MVRNGVTWVLILSVLPTASYIYKKLSYRKHSSSLLSQLMLPSLSLPYSKPHPQVSYRFCASIPWSVSTACRPFLDDPFQAFLIPSPVSLSTCDTHSFHPLTNTNSKLSLLLVWFINSPKISPMLLILHLYTLSLQLPYIQTIIKEKLLSSKLLV